MNILKDFPSQEQLIDWFDHSEKNRILKVNAHFHTPYSFSAFDNIPHVFDLARKEDIKVLGINDFYTTSGYDEFYEQALLNGVFPLFSIEFMGLLKEEQAKGIRINDPNNPGRTYFCGKGLNYPVTLDAKNQEILDNLKKESMKQTSLMVDKTNQHLETIDAPFSLSFEVLKNEYAKELVRERHIAKAVRNETYNYFKGEELKSFFQKLFGGKELKSAIDNHAAVENEIRGNLLKAGGPAFVEEDEKAFLSIPEVINWIKAAGGIPCYPVLLDDPKGNFTDFEGDKEKLAERLKSLGVRCIELIPGRNKFEILKDFVLFFKKKGFVITFGTEHNTPELIPLTVDCASKVPLDDELLSISFEGACVIAAHQYLYCKGKAGLEAVEQGNNKALQNFIKLGKAVIFKYLEVVPIVKTII